MQTGRVVEDWPLPDCPDVCCPAGPPATWDVDVITTSDGPVVSPISMPLPKHTGFVVCPCTKFSTLNIVFLAASCGIKNTLLPVFPSINAQFNPSTPPL